MATFLAAGPENGVVQRVAGRSAGVLGDDLGAGLLAPGPRLDPGQYLGDQRRDVGSGLGPGEHPGDLTDDTVGGPLGGTRQTSTPYPTASDPRLTSSCVLVSSRHTTARRSGPSASTASRRHSARRRGDSKNTHVR